MGVVFLCTLTQNVESYVMMIIEVHFLQKNHHPCMLFHTVFSSCLCAVQAQVKRSLRMCRKYLQ